MSAPDTAALAKTSRRLVIKIGSALLVDADGAWMRALADDIAAARADGQEILLVSSGAIALGRASLGLPEGPLNLETSQAAAAAGQMALMRAWQDAFAPHDIKVAQILLTLDDTEQRRRYLNARDTLARLLQLKVLPIINENDTVATAEIRYGDNDRLSARVAAMVSAELLVLFSDVDGLYTQDPQAHAAAEHVPLVENLTDDIRAMASDTANAHGRGGMKTKLDAAHTAMQAGCHTLLADGSQAHPLRALQTSARATLFRARLSPQRARKKWIAGKLKDALGTIVIDDGAAGALRAGKSLLPIGATAISGEFQRGDHVRIVSANGAELAQGLAAWGSADARRLLGKRSAEIPKLFGVLGREELVHRDDLVMMESPAD